MIIMQEFIIPLSKDDLLCAAEGSYVVQEVFTARSLPGKISDAVNVLNSAGPCNVREQFDVFFSVSKHFADLNNGLKFDCWKSLYKGLVDQMSDLVVALLEKDEMDRDTKKQHRNTLKMLSYLLTQFAEEFEAEDCKPSTTVGQGRKKSKKTTSTLPFDWSKVKEEFLKTVSQLLQTDIAKLWEPPVLEEEFVNTFANCCYKFLENPAVNRDKCLLDCILNIIGILVKRCNHSFSVRVKVIQLLQLFEHLVSPMAKLVQICVVEHGMTTMVTEILREIGQIDPQTLARDTRGTKCYSDFLIELASRIPEHILPNISLLLCHLENEPYSLRNGVLGVMGELVVLRLSQDDLNENMKKARDQILDCLEAHIHDVTAFVRSKVLQIWQNICKKKAIPLARQHDLLVLVIGRLQDKSSMGRKNAVLLLKEFLMSNPFGLQLPLSQVKKKLEEEKAKLKKMAPELFDDDDCDEVPVVCDTDDLKRWSEVECDIQRVVEDHWEVDDIEDEDGEHVEFQGDIHEALRYALMNIKRQLVSGDYLKALSVLKAAVVTWPLYEMFVRANNGKSSQESGESGYDEGTTKNKEDTVKREMSLLRKIFLNPQFGPVKDPKQVNDDETGQTSQAGQTDQDDQTSQTGEDGQDGQTSQAGQTSQTSSDNRNESNESSRIIKLNEVTKQQIVVKYLNDYVSFHSQMQDAVVLVCQLLGSSTASDVHEAIEFIVIAYEFGLNNALQGARRMLSSVWSKDSTIEDAIIEAYTRLYLNPQVQGQRAKAEAIVSNLIALLNGASIGELTSLDELVFKLMKRELIPKNVIHLLWEKFTLKVPQTTVEESRGALKLLGMLARAEPVIVQSNMEVLVNVGLGDRAKDEAVLVRETCTVLLKLPTTGEKTRDEKQRPRRLPSDHVIFQRLGEILVNSIRSPLGGMWVPMAEEAINVIYHLAEHPDLICGNLIKNSYKKVFRSEENLEVSDGNIDQATGDETLLISCPSNVLARFLAMLGHVALKQVVHLDTSVLGEIKRRERVKEEKKGRPKNKNGTPSTRSEKNDQRPSAKEGANETMEDEMGLTGASAEDAEAENIRTICDQEIVTGDKNLLSLIAPLVVSVCNNPAKYSDQQLQTSAALALSKFMVVSAEFCEENLQLLFTILEKSPHEVIRANTIIALGDLTARFPNLIEPWTPNLYARLRDQSCQVRKNTMMIMTHLILHDMVKVKGQISEMATCLEDKEPSIADLAKSFFHELSKKGNAVYNILPDIISRLSDPETGVQQDPFRNIMRYLFSFIQKDRQCESLVEKLCHRFSTTRTERQWLDVSFCLAQLTYNELAVRKLQENFASFQDKLSNDEVYGFFTAIITKCKKFVKPELKVVVEELESRIVTCHEKGLEDEAGYDRANQASAAARVLVGKTTATPGNKKSRSTKGRTPASRRRKHDSKSEALPKRKVRTLKSRKKVIEFDSDDDDLLDGSGDWGEVFDSGESENEENLEPNIPSEKVPQETKTPRRRTSSRKKKV